MTETSSKRVLFFSDSSLFNPIIHSQGLPLLMSLTEKGFECYVLSFENKRKLIEKKEQYNEIRRKYYPLISFRQVLLKEKNLISFLLNYFLSGFIEARKIITKNKIGIIHARSIYPAIIGLLLKIIYPNLKFIYDNRGVFIEEQVYLGQWKRGGARERIFKALEKLVIKKADSIIVVSKVYKSLLMEKQHSFGKLPDKISVINNKTRIAQEVNEEDLPKRKDANNIICVFSGSSAKWQNIDEIFSFTQKCIEKLDDFRFKILTYEKDKFQEKISAFKKLSQISEILSVNSDSVFEHLITANFGLLLRENNLINNVSSPLKFAEYLAAGLPVVVSEGVGDTAGIINHYNVGVVVVKNDYETAIIKLKDLLAEPDIYIRCMEVARKEFNILDSFKVYEKIYFDLS